MVNQLIFGLERNGAIAKLTLCDMAGRASRCIGKVGSSSQSPAEILLSSTKKAVTEYRDGFFYENDRYYFKSVIFLTSVYFGVDSL
jgi:hypothetical protein